jgi:hypothetical protein
VCATSAADVLLASSKGLNAGRVGGYTESLGAPAAGQRGVNTVFEIRAIEGKVVRAKLLCD